MLNTQAIRPTNAAEDRIPTIMQEKATKLVEAKLARVAAVTPPVVDAGAIPISFPYYDESFFDRLLVLWRSCDAVLDSRRGCRV
ncbi:hypothetical protein C8034_v009655 [Colletotrichum sidae]|uniref:Uncharacterized protein n=1 Tax=Colletotrichum sidae TaxID=1347389 RepID=A0A4V3I2U8_9PEZI|nr:hypothetical protein C8034_v009655 [Colletotrichum sidae]